LYGGVLENVITVADLDKPKRSGLTHAAPSPDNVTSF
jgi:hypothetical protein